MNRFLSIVFVAIFLILPSVATPESTSSSNIREVQYLLYRTGYNPGPIDGIWGQRTKEALENFLETKSVNFEGVIVETHVQMLKQTPVSTEYANRKHFANGRPIDHVTQSDGTTIFPGRWELPQYLTPIPNDETLQFHFLRWLGQRRLTDMVRENKPGTTRQLSFNIRESEFLENQLQHSSLLSYLFFDNGEIIFDGMAPSSRFDKVSLDNETEFRSNSVGKSLVSYLIGHAICEGYIDSIFDPMNDWPIIEGTLYTDQPIIDLLNMRARDQHVVTEEDGILPTEKWAGRWFNNAEVKSFAERELKGTLPNRNQIYNYNGLVSNVLLQYMIFKTAEDWDSFFERVIYEKIGAHHNFYFQQLPSSSNKFGLWYSFFASRYDYLRLAITMLEDWQQNTCVGEYLKDIYAERKSMNHRFSDPNRMMDVAKSYGGQFLFDFSGMQSRPIFGLNGYGGQNIAIDMDNGRIVVTNAAHTSFDWRTLVYKAIEHGDLPN